MKYRNIIKNLFLMAAFFTILIILLSRVMYVFREKGDGGENVRQDNFARLARDSVDVIFIGTSHQYCSINTDLLYEEYGINGYMLATSVQTVPMSYYAAMEAIELQHPDVIVFEVLYCTYDYRTVSPERSHAFFDGMPMCHAKREGIEDLIEEDQRIYYYLNFGLYHNRWKNLTEEDFQSVLISPRGNYFTDSIVPIRSIPVVAPEEKEEIPEEMLRYLEMMVELCRQNNVKLIWYVAPYNSIETSYTDLFQEQRMFNWIGDYAAEQGIPFYNLFYEMDQIGLEFDKDFRDSQHLNCYGQEKLTHYMAEMGYFDY